MKINKFVDYQGAIYFFAAHCIALRSVRIPESLLSTNREREEMTFQMAR